MKMPSSVDWSEFHVWCYMLEDVQKRSQRPSVQTITKPKDAPTLRLNSASLESLDLAMVATSIANTFNQSDEPRKRSNTFSPGRRRHNSSPGPTPLTPPLQHETSFQSQRHHSAQSAAFRAYSHFSAGAIGGGTATYATHWLDTIKVKMQSCPKLYGGMWSCLGDTMREEGVRGLYQGATPAVLAHAGKAAIVFMAYGLCQELVKQLTGDCDKMSVSQHATAGAMTGVFASLFLCPLELVKCRMQASGNKAETRSPTCVARQVMATEGFKGFYRGLTGIWAKEIPGSFIYFGSYELVKSAIRAMKESEDLDTMEVFLSGTAAGLCFCVTHPVETVKTRVQVAHVTDRKGFFSAGVHILKNEGLWPLCSGLKPSATRACIFSGVQFLTYEAVKDFFLHDIGRDRG